MSDRLGEQAALLDAVRVQTLHCKFLRNSSPNLTMLTVQQDVLVGGGLYVGALNVDPPTGDILTSGGIHVGGTSDPGDDNLIVDGKINVVTGIGIGGATPSTANALMIRADSYIDNYLDAYSTLGGASFVFRRARGTISSPAAASSGDNLGGIQMGGYDGDEFHRTAIIRAEAESAVSNNVVPTCLTFWTSATTAAAIAERMRITSAGVVQIGGRALTFGANNSFSAGYRTVCIANA